MKRSKAFLLSEKTYGWLIGALLVTLPLFHGFSTAAMIALLLVSLLSLMHHKAEWKWSYVVPLLLFALMLISYFWTEIPSKWSRGVERELALLLIPILFIAMPAVSKKVRATAFYAFAISLAVFAIIFVGLAAYAYSQTGDKTVFFYHSLVKPFDLNAIYISTMVSLSLLYVLFDRTKTKWNLLLIFILSGFLVLLSSKNLIITTGIAGLLGYLISRKLKAKRLLLLGSLGLVLFAAFYISPLRQRMSVELTSNVNEVLYCEDFTRIYPWTGSSIRLFQARIFFEMLEDDPILFTGYGINASQHKILEKHLQYNLYQGFHTYNFHNQYIQSFAELGVFGFLFIVLLLAVVINGYRNTKDLMFLFFFIVMLAVFFTESYLWRHRGLIHFLVLYCLLFKTLPLNNKTGD